MSKGRREAVYTDRAPRPVGPYSQGVIAGECMLFVSGQIPVDPETGELVKGSFGEQAKRALENLKAVVEAAGGSMDDLVKVTVYITDMNNFSEFNRIYSEYFKSAPPARAVVEVSRLPLDVSIEIEAIAYLC